MENFGGGRMTNVPLDKSRTPRMDATLGKGADWIFAEGCRLERELGAKQAQLDRLMLEFCPDEMTAEQTDEWAKHQRPASAERAIERSTCSLCAKVPSDGFHTGCMYEAEGRKPINGWHCDGNGNLSRPTSPERDVQGRPRGAYVPFTVKEIDLIRAVLDDGTYTAQERSDIGKLCDMAINCLLYGEEIQRLRDGPASSIAPLGWVEEDMVRWLTATTEKRGTVSLYKSEFDGDEKKRAPVYLSAIQDGGKS